MLMSVSVREIERCGYSSEMPFALGCISISSSASSALLWTPSTECKYSFLPTDGFFHIEMLFAARWSQSYYYYGCRNKPNGWRPTSERCREARWLETVGVSASQPWCVSSSVSSQSPSHDDVANASRQPATFTRTSLITKTRPQHGERAPA